MKHLYTILALAVLPLCSLTAAERGIADFPSINGSQIDTAADSLLLIDASAANPQGRKMTFAQLANVSGLFAASSHTHSLSNLTQSGATTGQVATWNGTAWTAATPNTTAAGISDSTAAGRALLTAADTAAQQSIIVTNESVSSSLVGPYADNDAAIRAGVHAGRMWEKSDHSLWRAANPSVTKIAVFGDSRADQSGSAVSYNTNGIAYWVQVASGFRLSLVKNASPLNGTANDFAFAQGGQSWATMNNDTGSYPRVAELIAACPAKTVVCCYNGTNGMSDPAANYASFVTVIQRFIAADLWPIVFLEPDTGTGQPAPDYNANRDIYNASVEAYCIANNIPYIDVRSQYHDGDGPSFPYLFYSDGGFIHPNIKGAAIVGREFARKIEAKYTLPAFPVTYSSISSAVSADKGFVSGAFGNGSTTGFNTSASNCTLARSMVARTDGQTGYWARLAITNFAEGNATGTGAGSVQLLWSTTTMPALGSYRAVVEVEVDEWLETEAASGYVNGKYLTLMGTAQGGTSSTARVGLVTSSVEFQTHTLGHRGSVNPAPTSGKIALITEPFTVGGTNTSLGLYLNLYGNMIVRVGNMAIIPVP